MSWNRISPTERREQYLENKKHRGELSLAGKDGLTSSEKQESSESDPPQPDPFPAQTTEPSSSPDPEVSGSADSADGGTTGKGIKFYNPEESK